MKTSVKLLLAFATAAAAIAPAAAQQVVAWDEAYRQADARIAQLTLDEKISFMRGYSSFFFYGVPEKGMPYIYLSDATQGVHMRDNLSDPTMVRQLERSTAFPCPISLAATFNPSLAYRYAEAVGEECRAGGIEVLLGPGMNIYRNSQNGRNFEYMGEDPLLASAMVAEYVKGMQSTGTVACLKHFICNETEFYRRLPAVRAAAGDRAALRAIHVFDENRRAAAEAEALRKGDFPAFLALVNASGASSWQYLQNVTSGDPRQQALAVTLAVCRRALGGQGAVRVHGGGFAGTALAFVPDDRREMFRRTVEQTLGVDKCRLLSVRNPLAHSGRYC